MNLPGASSISMSSRSSGGDGSSDDVTGMGRLQSDVAPYFCWRASMEGESINMSGVIDMSRASGDGGGRCQGVPLRAPAVRAVVWGR